MNLESAAKAACSTRASGSASGEDIHSWQISGLSNYVRDGNEHVPSQSDLTVVCNNTTLQNSDYTITRDAELDYSTAGFKRVLISGAEDYVSHGSKYLYYSIWSSYRVEIPYLLNEIFDYSGTTWYVNTGSHTLDASNYDNFGSFDSNYVSYSGTTSASNAGVYSVTFSLIDASSTMWADGSTTTKSSTWRVGTIVAIPSLTKSMFAYNGTDTFFICSGTTADSGTSNLAGFDAEKVDISGSQSATTPGAYTITFTLKDTTSCLWDDYTNTSKSLTWRVNLKKPTLTRSTFTYAGSTWYVLTGTNTSGTSGNVNFYYSDYLSYSGTYSYSSPNRSLSVTFSLRNTTNYRWYKNDTTDDGTSNFSINWIIERCPITIPTANTLYYTGGSQTGVSTKTGTQLGFTNSYYGYSNTMYYNTTYPSKNSTASARNVSSATNVGKYYTTLYLQYPSYYRWSNVSDSTIGSSGSSNEQLYKYLNVDWEILPATVAKPTDDCITNKTLSYTGSTLYIRSGGTNSNASSTANLDTTVFDANKMDIVGTLSASASGEYSASIVPKSNYTWTDGTSTPVSFVWKIGMQTILIPTPTTSFTYDSTPKTLIDSPSGYTVTGDNIQTNAGSYTATLTLDSGKQWSDSTTAPKTINWQINPKTVDLSSLWQNTSAVDYDASSHNIPTVNSTTPITGQTITFNTTDNNSNTAETLPGTYTITASISSITNDGLSINYTLTNNTCEWTINAKYRITLSINYDETCENTATAFAKVIKVNAQGENIGNAQGYEVMFDGKTNNESSKTYSFNNLNDGYYKVSVSTSTNHLATISSMTYNTTAYDMIIVISVTKNNFGTFYGSSQSQNNVNSSFGEIVAVTSYLSFADGVGTAQNGGFEIVWNDYDISQQQTTQIIVVVLSLFVGLLIGISTLILIHKKHTSKTEQHKNQLQKPPHTLILK